MCTRWRLTSRASYTRARAPPHVDALASYQPRIVCTCARPSARGDRWRFMTYHPNSLPPTRRRVHGRCSRVGLGGTAGLRHAPRRPGGGRRRWCLGEHRQGAQTGQEGHGVLRECAGHCKACPRVGHSKAPEGQAQCMAVGVQVQDPAQATRPGMSIRPCVLSACKRRISKERRSS